MLCKRGSLCVFLFVLTLAAVGFAENDGCLWTEMLAKPTTSWMNAVIVGEERLVAVGAKGTILTSDDGVTLLQRESRTRRSLRDVIWTGASFLGVGDNVVVASPDGIDWAISVAPERFESVAFGGGWYLATTTTGELYSSIDGIAWHNEWLPQDFFSRDAVWIGGAWVVVGSKIMYGMPGGPWHLAVLKANLECVAWNGEIVAAAGNDLTWTSRDGISWTAHGALPIIIGGARTIIHDGAYFVVAGGYEGAGMYPGGGFVAWSVDGENWLVGDEDRPRTFSITRFQDRWIAVGDNGAIDSSSDLQEWRHLSHNSSMEVENLTWNGAQYLAIGGFPTHYVWMPYALVSDDGLNWRGQDMPRPATHYEDVEWSNNRWFAAGGNGIIASSDGNEWEDVLESAFRYSALSNDGPRLVAVGGDRDGRPAAAIQDQSGDWTEIILPGSGNLRGVVSHNERYVAVGSTGLVAWSDGGYEWSEVTARSESDLNSVAWGGGIFVAVGTEGTVITSSDGAEWQLVETQLTGNLKSLVWIDDRFVVSGNMILESVDGFTWTILAEPPDVDSIANLLWDGSRLIAAGKGYSITELKCSEIGPGSDHTNTAIVPVTAHQSGEGESVWTSDVHLMSRSEKWTEAWIGFAPGDNNNSWQRFIIPPAGQVSLPDLVARTFGRTQDAGSLVIRSMSPMMATSRTSTRSDGGTYGQTIPGVGTPLGERVVLAQLTENETFRTNIGATNLSDQPLKLDIELRDAFGQILGQTHCYLGAYEWKQFGSLVRELARGDLDDGYAFVSSPTPGAQFFAYASLVDNMSNDSSFIQPTKPTTEIQIIAAAAHSRGVGQTYWNTEVAVVNVGQDIAEFHFEFLQNRAILSAPIVLEPGEARRFHDVIGEIFKREAVGALRVVPARGKVVVTSRTSTQSGSGQFGQYVPAKAENEVLMPEDGYHLLGLNQSDGFTEGFRTNIGLVNLAEETTEVSVELYRGDGSLIHVLTIDLAGERLIQLNRVFAPYGVVINGFAIVRSASPGSPVLAYASVIDNVSGDPVFVQAQ